MTDKPKRVLIIDDSAADTAAAMAVLRRAGFEADAVTDGLEAIEAIRGRNYSCILLDLRMTTFNGDQLIDYIAIDAPELLQRVIIVSGFHAFADELVGRVGGVVRKPYTRNQLESAVRTCIARSSP